MTLLNHTAILNSHSNVVNILDEGDTTTAYDVDAKVVTIDTTCLLYTSDAADE